MYARVAVAGLIAAAACRGSSVSSRDRVLTKLAPDVFAVLAGEGKALTTPPFRGLVDYMGSQLPKASHCVVDAALTGDQVAVSWSEHGTTIVIATTAPVKCPALSKIGPELWVATIGTGKLATGESVLTDPRFERARKYLASAPLAVYVDDPAIGRFLATAQPTPLEAWLAVDIDDADMATAVERELRAFVTRLSADVATAVASSHVTVSRDQLQVVARLDGASPGDLAAVVRAALHAPPRLTVDRRPAIPAAPRCPHLRDPVVDCKDDGKTLVVSSLAAVADLLGRAELAPRVASGQVDGLRVTHDVDALGLVAGDEIIEAAGRHVTTAMELVDALRGQHGATTLSFQRAGQRTVLAIVARGP
jgi:hypothetical protein